MTASVVMLLLHILLALRERRRSFVNEDLLKAKAVEI
jgi:hypothetical protein